jgi:hypothetical protein
MLSGFAKIRSIAYAHYPRGQRRKRRQFAIFRRNAAASVMGVAFDFATVPSGKDLPSLRPTQVEWPQAKASATNVPVVACTP